MASRATRLTTEDGMDQLTPRGATVVVRSDKGLTLEHPTFELTLPGGKRTSFDATRVRIGAGPGNDLRSGHNGTFCI